jgi:hypothetical protein
MTEQEIADRLAREPKAIRDIYEGLRGIVAGGRLLDLAEGSPEAELVVNAALALIDFEDALEVEATVKATLKAAIQQGTEPARPFTWPGAPNHHWGKRRE